MADIFIMGHGAWETQTSNKPFVTVPSRTSVVFYTPVGRFISSTQTVAIIRNLGNKLPVDREIGAFKTVPNLALSDGLFDDEIKALLHTGARFARVTQDTSLEELMERYAGNRLHWLACMPRLGGKDTTEGGFNDDYFPNRGVGV